MFDVSLTSRGNSCIDDAHLGGIHNVAMCIIKSSLILKSLSAMISSEGSNMFKNPLFLTIKTSDALPPYHEETHEIAPFGVIATRTLKV